MLARHTALSGRACAAVAALAAALVGASPAHAGNGANILMVGPAASLSALWAIPEQPTIAAADLQAHLASVGALPASANCSIQAFGHALTPGFSVGGGGVDVPQITVGSVTVGPFVVPIPPATAASTAVGGGVAACDATPGFNNQLLPPIAGIQCTGLYAQVVDTANPTAVPFLVPVSDAHGSGTCNPLVPNYASPVAVGQIARTWSNLVGSGTRYGGSGSTLQYSGVYDAVSVVDATVAGVVMSDAAGCGHSACSNYDFSVG